MTATHIYNTPYIALLIDKVAKSCNIGTSLLES